MKSRVVIIGIDGIPYSLMRRLSDNGIMPNFKELRENGMFMEMSSSIPEVSSVSWSSIITGKNPGEHGVYGFTDLISNSYILSFHDFTKLKAPAFWQKSSHEKYVIINVPSTYPAREINGFMVSGFVSPDLGRAVYPPSYVNLLKDIDYRIDIDTERAHRSPRVLFKELYKTLRVRLKLCRHLWNEPWDIFMIVFTGSDRIGHFLWDAYRNKGNEWHHAFLEYFKELDRAIGEINSWLKKDDRLVIVSDHGMEQAKANVNINTWLTENGYLMLDDNPRKGYNAILRGSKAFALEPNRVYLNRVGKYPRGTVEKEKEERLTGRLIELFYDLKIDGQKIIERVYRREEVYHGKYVKNAPDLLLVAKPGFSLRSTLFRKELFEEDELTGKHNREAFLYVKGVNDRRLIPENPSVEDIIKIINRLREMKV